MSVNKKHNDIDIQREELLAHMEKHISRDLKILMDLSYKLSEKKPNEVKVITSNSTSIPKRSHAESI